MLNAQVKSLKENIIVGLRLVDDRLIKCNGYPNVSITKLLLKSAKDSYDKHNIGLEQDEKSSTKAESRTKQSKRNCSQRGKS